MACTYGHICDEHSDTGECQADECPCVCYEEHDDN